MGYPAFPSLPLLLASLAAPLVLAGCSTSTYGTGENPEMALVREVTGGLLSNGEKKEPIDYQPRAPLVMPPHSGELPQPVETASVANPDWPADPNERVLASAAQLDDDPRNDVSQEEYRRLKPLSGVFAAAVDNEDGYTGKEDYYRTIVHGKAQRDKFRAAVAERKGFTRTERRFLTDPPLTYRDPAPTAPGTEEVKAKKKRHWWQFGNGEEETTNIAAVPVTERAPEGKP